jgi:hypothetical protein
LAAAAAGLVVLSGGLAAGVPELQPAPAGAGAEPGSGEPASPASD